MSQSTFAHRVSQIEISGIRRLFELSANMKNPIDLSLGQADFDVPEAVKQKLYEAVAAGKNRYTPSAGIPEFRNAAMERLKQEGISTNSVMAIAGASAGLNLAMLVLADENTDVYIADPYFVAYPQIIKLANSNRVTIDTYPDFRLTPERIRARVDERAKELGAKAEGRKRVLIYNSPANPTGTTYSETEIKALVKCTQDLKFTVISDEVYDSFCLDQPHLSWLKYDPSAVLVRAFSKTGGMPGWRIGFAAAPLPILTEMIKMQQFTYVCVNAPAQWAVLPLFNHSYSSLLEDYRMRRDFVMKELVPAYQVQKSGGSFYLFVKYPEKMSGDEFIKRCMAKELLVVPGSTFSARDTHFRLSFSASIETLKKGIAILNEIASH